MSHPFGNMIKKVLSRNHDLNQSKLSQGINCNPALISRMCKGERLSTPSARGHIIRMINWFVENNALESLEEANYLLQTAGLSPLRKDDLIEANIIKSFPEIIVYERKIQSVSELQPVVSKAILHNLSHPDLQEFFGRENEKKEILRQLLPLPDTYTHLISINGIGGVGKSSLVLEIAYHFLNNSLIPERERFDAIVWTSSKEEWFTNEGIVPKKTRVSKTLDDIIATIGITLGCSEKIKNQDKNLQSEIVYQILKQQRTLLIVDNFENIDDDAVIGFLQELPPPTKAIVTTRIKIDFAYSINLEGMLIDESIQYIDYISSQYKLAEIKEKDKRLLHQRTGGVPLALMWSLGQLRFDIDIDLVIKKLGAGNIRDVAKFTFDQLFTRFRANSSLKVLAALSIFETSATRTTLGIVAGFENEELTRDECLIELEKLSLISKKSNEFTMLPLTRSYVLAKLEEEANLREFIYLNLIDWLRHNLDASSKGKEEIIEYLAKEQQLLYKIARFGLEHGNISFANLIINFFEVNINNYDHAELEYIKKDVLTKTNVLSKPTRFELDSYNKATNFIGRESEIDLLKKWVVQERQQLIFISGFGGIGKTTFAMELSRRIAGEFNFVILKSLASAIAPDELLTQCLQTFMDSPSDYIPDSTQEKIDLFAEYLEKYRCLVILDNFETVLKKGESDQFVKGFDAYENIIEAICTRRHNSCVILTTRERPSILIDYEKRLHIVKGYSLGGMNVEDVKILLETENIEASDDNWATLVHRCSGNPLAIKMVAKLVKESYDSNLVRYLSEERGTLPDIFVLLDQQYIRLSRSEKEILTWLAIENEPITIEDVKANILDENLKQLAENCLDKLESKSFVEIDQQKIRLQTLIAEYIIRVFTQKIVEEIFREALDSMYRFSILKAHSKDYIRTTQIRLIVRNIVQGLQDILGTRNAVLAKLEKILTLVRKVNQEEQGYAVANIIDLLRYLDHDLEGYDFSGMSIRQAFLQSTNLHNVNLSDSNLTGTIFADVFDLVLSVTYNNNGTLLAVGGADGEVTIWDTIELKQIKILYGHKGWVRTVAFHPFRNILASAGGDKIIKLWDEDLETARELIGHTDWIRSIAFSPDGNFLASASSDRTIRIWDINTGKEEQILSGHTDWIWSLAFSKDGKKLVSGSNDGTVRIWDLENKVSERVLRGHDGWVRTVAFSPNNQLVASAGDDQVIRLWNVESGELVKILEGHQNQIWAIGFTPEGEILFSGGYDKTIILWDVSNGNKLRILRGHFGWVTSLSCSPDNKVLISGSDDQTLRLWDVQTGKPNKVFQGTSNKINSISYLPGSNLLASGGTDRQVRLWNTSDGQCEKVFSGHTNRIKSVAISHDGKLLASCSDDQTIRIQNLVDNKSITLRDNAGWIWSIAFSPDDKLLVSGSDLVIRIWDLQKGEYIKSLNDHTSWISSVAFSSDGQKLVSGSADKTIKLWDVSSGQAIMTLYGHELRVNTVAYGFEKIISGSDDKRIRIWNSSTGKCEKVLEGHSAPIRSIAVSHAQNIFASSSDDRTVRLWNIDTRKSIKTFDFKKRLTSATFTSDGDFLAVSDETGEVSIWDVNKLELANKFMNVRMYEGMKITRVTGLTETQKINLKILGAYE